MSTSGPMTMQQPNHPDDERLAALAASEPDAVADSTLATHVSGCPRCAPMVEELRTLQSALADLPDISPPRPLRFLPGVPEATPARPGWLGVLRGLTAPAMAVAVVMILVGAIGTAGGGLASFGSAGAAAPSANFFGAGAPAASSAEQDKAFSRSAAPVPAALGQGTSPPATARDNDGRTQSGTSTSLGAETSATETGRPPFGLLLGGGVVLLAAAFLLRGYVRRRSLA